LYPTRTVRKMGVAPVGSVNRSTGIRGEVPMDAASAERERMVSALRRGLEDYLPAPDVLGAVPDAPSGAACDYLYIQGRGDRLHGFLCVGSDAPLPAPDQLERFADTPANWLSIVVREEDYARRRTPIEQLAARYRLGIVGIERTRLSTLRHPPPRPGIFLPRHRALRERWRRRSSF
jgi:hypothetical protein